MENSLIKREKGEIIELTIKRIDPSDLDAPADLDHDNMFFDPELSEEETALLKRLVAKLLIE